MNRLNRNALLAGIAAASALTACIYIGSRGLRHFDPAVLGYAVGSVLAAFAAGCRFAVWVQRPPSRMYFKRGLQLLLRRVSKTGLRITHHASLPVSTFHAPRTLVGAFAINFAAQNFIRRRSYYRWLMHLCLSGGCTLAFAITFPLVFGWIHFESFADNAEMYRVKIFGFVVDSGFFALPDPPDKTRPGRHHPPC